MKKGICFVVALLVVIGVFNLALARKPESGTGIGMFEQHLVGTWDVVNKSSAGAYNDAEGEVVFSWAEEGIEVEVTSGIFAAGAMNAPESGPFFEFCIGAWPITLYERSIAIVEWEAISWNGNPLGPRKSPLHIVKLSFDKILIIGMGYKGMGASILTRR